MSDGRQSPVIGTRNCIDMELELDPERAIGQIQVLESSDKKYVNAIRFLAHKANSDRFDNEGGQLLGEIIGAEQEGNWKYFNLELGE